MKKYIVLNKKIGETPLMAIEKWKKQNPDYINVSASYAGRLDPMASGKLLVLLGEECKRQQEYTNLDKEYEIEVLLCAESDTGDALGLIKLVNNESGVNQNSVKFVLRKEIGRHQREYPIFSSKTVSGKPLFLYALDGTVGSIKIPVHNERIYSIKMLGKSAIASEKLQARISGFLELAPTSNEPSKELGADFRIDAVRTSWKEFFKKTDKNEFTILKLKVICSSGTYMRSLAPRIGESLGTKALALSINRTKIGKYASLFNAVGLWVHEY